MTKTAKAGKAKPTKKATTSCETQIRWMPKKKRHSKLTTLTRDVVAPIASLIKQAYKMGLQELIQRVCDEHFVAVVDLFRSGLQRVDEHTLAARRARKDMWWRLRQPPYNFSYPRIARVFGVDHTTVLKTLRRYEQSGASAGVDGAGRCRPDPGVRCELGLDMSLPH